MQLFPGNGQDFRTIGEFLNTNHEIINRFPKHAAGALGALLTEAELYLTVAGKYRVLADAFRLQDKDELLKVLTSYTRENESPDDAWKAYEAALKELSPQALQTLANRCERNAATLEEPFIQHFLQKLRVNITGADGKFIQDLIQVATNAPPGGVAPAELGAGRNGNNGGNVYVVNSSERKERDDGWSGLPSN